jgi:AcrR family transcriptional regulator
VGRQAEPGENGGVRRRLSVENRRAELLRVGMQLFSRRAYEEIGIEEIAQEAGISRGLLYHYFPTKREFYAAVTRAAAGEVDELTAAAPGPPGAAQLRAGIEAYLRYAQEHPHGFLSAYRGTAAADPDVRATVEEGRRRQTGRIIEGPRLRGAPPPQLRLAVYGWTAMTQAITAEWLERPEISRSELAELLADALGRIVAAATAGSTTRGRGRSRGRA